MSLKKNSVLMKYIYSFLLFPLVGHRFIYVGKVLTAWMYLPSISIHMLHYPDGHIKWQGSCIKLVS